MAEPTLEQRIAEAKEKERQHYRRLAVILPVVLVLVLVGVWFAIGEISRRNAEHQMQNCISTAHTFALVVSEWQERGKEIESGIWRVDDTDEAFSKNLLYYFSDAKGHWFGLVLDEDGNIRYTLYSRSEIPDEYLQEPPDYEEQYALLRSRFYLKRKKAVAVWEPETEADTDSE